MDKRKVRFMYSLREVELPSHNSFAKTHIPATQTEIFGEHMLLDKEDIKFTRSNGTYYRFIYGIGQ